MIYAKRMGAALLACLLLMGMLPAFTQAEETATGLSTHGAFAAELSGTVYAALYTGSDYGLYAVPTDGGELRQLDVASEISDLVSANGFLYYLRTLDGQQEIMRVDGEGNISMLTAFEVDVVADRLSWYEDVLYCLAGGRLYIVDPDVGESYPLCEELVDDYVFVGNAIYFINGREQLTYERSTTGQDEPIKQTAGTLWTMQLLGTEPKLLVDKGVTDLRAYGDYLFFHNLEDNYVTGLGDNLWLEGKLYRYNIETAQMASMNLNYDWDYYPTANGVVVYTSQDVSLYPLTGGEKTQLMTPDLQANVTAFDGYAYVYEYGVSKLTRLPLDGSEAVVLADDSDVLPSITSAAPEDDAVITDDPEEGATTDDDGEDIEDTTYDESSNSTSSGTSSSYIFPNSSKKKLTRKQVLAIDKSLWGYARNEIYARHGYVFKKSQYKNYFSKKSWYKPGGFSTGSLNSIEWYNMELIKGLEQEYGLLDGTGSSSSSSNSSAKNNSYVLKEASSKKLTKKYLRNKLGSKSKYALARNEILARHGYVFKTAKYKKYFNNQKWYKPGGYSSSKLSSIEWYNIEQLKALENE